MRDSLKEIEEQVTYIYLHRRKEVIFYHQIHMCACIGTKGGGGKTRQTDGKREISFNETHICCVTHYNHSVWPACKDEG